MQRLTCVFGCRVQPVPVTWTSLGLMAVTGVSLMVYYQLEKERKQEEGKCKEGQ